MAEKKSGGKKIFKIILMLFLLLALVIGGFALGVYLRIFDTAEMNEKLGLYKLPVVGEYFVKPAPPQEEMEEKPLEDVKPKTEEKKQSKKITLTKKEIEEQMKQRESAEKKRVSKLARLYNGMKPKDAAEAMDALDDDLAVTILQKMDEGTASKVLSEFEPAKAARLTQLIYEGTKKNLQTAADIEKQLEAEARQGEGATVKNEAAPAQ
ncbi:MAG: magnesium transporter MgtE [Selenomonas sp.]|jgi:flagellar motility protein MotE (MotC chaperone)|nr:magnesium transporter MgtE [Selenomonas sp.]